MLTRMRRVMRLPLDRSAALTSRMLAFDTNLIALDGDSSGPLRLNRHSGSQDRLRNPEAGGQAQLLSRSSQCARSRGSLSGGYGITLRRRRYEMGCAVAHLRGSSRSEHLTEHMRRHESDHESPWSPPIVVRRSKANMARHIDVLEATARAVVTSLADPRSQPGGDWHEAVDYWRDGAIRKVVRRGDGKKLEDARALGCVSVSFGGDAD